MTKCITCGNIVPPFSPNPNYCCKDCEDKGGDNPLNKLKEMLGI